MKDRIADIAALARAMRANGVSACKVGDVELHLLPQWRPRPKKVTLTAEEIAKERRAREAADDAIDYASVEGFQE